MLRARILDETKRAMKARDSQRVSVLRMMSSAIKDLDIAARVGGSREQVPDSEILLQLGKMVKQRRESATAFDYGNRPELAASELAEVGVIEEFLPRKLMRAEAEAAIVRVIEETGAKSVKDMSKVMAALKTRHAGEIDLAQAGKMVKDALGGS